MTDPAKTHSEPGFSADRAPIVAVQNLNKSFPVSGGFIQKQFVALRDISFSLYPGQCIALVGESGSGKSTLLKVLSRLESATSGEFFFQGSNLFSLEPHRASLSFRSQVQMIFQDPFGSLNPLHTVHHHLARPLLRHKKVKKGAALNSRIDDLLHHVGLSPSDEFITKRPHELSGGQRQRVVIARALAVEPAVILADEPISMLDVSIRMGILTLLEELKITSNMAILYVTHDLASARFISERIMVMYAGSIVEEGPTETIVTSPAHPYTKLLLAAVPNPTEHISRQLPVLKGDSTKEVPAKGCAFALRCPEAFKQCHHDAPLRRVLNQTDGSSHAVRCHLQTGNS